MAVPVGSILTISTKIAEYLGLIESLSSDVKKLIHQSLKSAITNLDYAKNAYDETNQRRYICQATNEFIRAIAVEENENLVSAYLGLAICQYLTGDICNSNNTIGKVYEIKLSKSERAKAIAKDTFLRTAPVLVCDVQIIRRAFGDKGKHEKFRELSLDLYKNVARNHYNKIQQ